MTIPAAESLAQRLRQETKDLHVTAERSGVMRFLLRGTIDRATYVRMLRSLGVIYGRLESQLASTTSPAAAAFNRAELARADAIARDADVIAGDDASLRALVAAQSAISYEARLVEIANHAPHRLVAHAYVRYFGDLSGGQMLEPLIRKAIPLPEAMGTDFYRFSDIVDIDEYKRIMRGLLNATSPYSSEGNDIVDEAKRSFRAHIELFEELAPTPTT